MNVRIKLEYLFRSRMMFVSKAETYPNEAAFQALRSRVDS